MFCSNCGKENEENAKFCIGCGKELMPVTDEKTDSTEEQVWSDFVGKNYDYYKYKWAQKDDPARAPSWNWAAFLLGIFWLGYRKMYKPIFILIGVFLIGDLIEILTGYHDLAVHAATYLPMICYVMVGIYGNALYYKHAQTQIARARESYDDNMVKYTGGTSGKGVAGAIGILAGYFIIFTILLSIFTSGSIVFGANEGSHGVTDIKSSFSADEEIFYEVDFGEAADVSSVDVHLIQEDNGNELVYAQFEEWVEPDWTGFYNYLYDPDYDFLESGSYIVRVYRDGDLLSEGSFEIKGTVY
ncbi:DUF2628 domain-containing protein [Amphibacillus sp. Q70]|uniref:DUF2628 domain-containing protein n=1 Tax=Amphibacillus sp. Q70 TaxID=3453416 RepID=UPI003F86EB08